MNIIESLSKEFNYDAVLIVVITALLNGILWLIQRFINTKTIRVERRKTELESRKLEFETIDEMTAKYEELSKRYIETRDVITELTLHIEENCSGLREMKKNVEDISNENNALRVKIEAMDISIGELKIENEGLRKKSRELGEGIKILIDQLKGVGLSPNWHPDENY